MSMLAGRMPHLAFSVRSQTPLERAQTAIAALTQAERDRLYSMLGVVSLPGKSSGVRGEAERWCKAREIALVAIIKAGGTSRLRTSRNALVRHLRDRGHSVRDVADVLERTRQTIDYTIDRMDRNDG